MSNFLFGYNVKEGIGKMIFVCSWVFIFICWYVGYSGCSNILYIIVYFVVGKILGKLMCM